MKLIDDHIKSMGMMLKPSKCRSFSLKGGRPVKEIFNINEHPVPSIADEEQEGSYFSLESPLNVSIYY